MTTTLLNPTKLLLRVERYNGGWTKSVTGINRQFRTGFSIQGEFMGRGEDLYEIGKLYLDCDIGGSRENQFKYYRLFRVTGEQQVQLIATVEGRNWALQLWNVIEKELGK